MSNMKNVLSAKELNQASVQISKSATELGKVIHFHLLSLMDHVIVHRDTTVVGVFVALMAKTDKEGNKTSVVRSEAIKKWSQDFAFTAFNTNKESGKLETKLSKAKYNEANGDEFKAHKAKAKVTVWNKYVPERALSDKPFDLEAAIDAAIESLEKTIEAAKAGTGRFERQTPAARILTKDEANKAANSERLQKLFELRRETADVKEAA